MVVAHGLHRSIREVIFDGDGVAAAWGPSRGERLPRRSDLRDPRPNPVAQHPVLSFDTHAAVVSLVDSGMPERQAETVVRLQVRLIEQHFATKADVGKVNSTVESVHQEVTDKIGSVHQELTDKIGSVHQELTDKIESVHQELTDKIESVRQELTDKIGSLHQEVTDKIESVHQEVTDKIESVRQEVTDKIESVRQEVTYKIESVRQEVTDKIESVRQELKADIASLKSDLVKWMIGTNLAFATLLIAAIKVF